MLRKIVKIGFILLLVISSIVFKNPLIQDLLLTIGGILFILFFSPKKITFYILVAFIIRVILIFINNFVFVLPAVRGSDAGMFESMGAMWAQNGFIWVIKNFVSGSFMYSWLIALIYSVFGRNPFIVQLFNSFLSVMVGMYVYKIVGSFLNEEKAMLPTVIALFFPSIVYFSVLPLREMVIVFPLVFGVYLFLIWMKSRSICIFSLSILMFMISYGFHTAIIYTLCTALVLVVIDLAKHIRHRSRKDVSRDFYGVILILIVFLIIFETGYGLEKAGWLISTPSTPSNLSLLEKAILYVKGFSSRVFLRLSEAQKNAARDRAAYLKNMQTHNFHDLIWQTPIRVVYFLFSPLLFQYRSILDLVGLLDALAIAFLVAGVFFSLKSVVKESFSRLTLLFMLVGILVFAVTVSNYGTALRHRAKFVPLMLVLSSDFLEKFKLFFKHRSPNEKNKSPEPN